MADTPRFDDTIEDPISPEWLWEALDAARTSPDFMAKCRDAALAAHDISQLRHESEEMGFACTPFHDYVGDLARRRGLPLDRVMRWLDITNLECLDRAAIRPLARLGQDLGLSAREVCVLLRASLAVQAKYAALPLPAHRGPDRATVTPLVACSLTLEEIEGHYPPALQDHLRMICREVEAQFEAGDAHS